MQDEVEQLPALYLAEVIRWQTKFMDLLLPAYLGVSLEGEAFQKLAERITCMLTKTKIKTVHIPWQETDATVTRAVRDTISAHVGGLMPDVQTLKDFASILAGNVHKLKAGQPVLRWGEQTTPEWVLAVVTDTRPYHAQGKNVHGTMLTFRILTGGAATRDVEQFFSDMGLNRMAKRLGVKGHKDRHAVHPRELVLMYVLVKLKAGLELAVERYADKLSLVTRNRKKAAYRAAYKKQCPKQSKWPCVFCAHGLDVCPLGTHLKSYTRRMCVHGHMGWVNPDVETGTCLACQQRGWYARRGGIYGNREEIAGQSSSSNAGDVDTRGGPERCPAHAKSM